MQTFLPHKDFLTSIRCLDNKRLGKQRVEAMQILNTLHKIKTQPLAKIGWRKHPAVLMWKNYENALLYYGYLCCDEWKKRGYKDNIQTRFSGYESPIKTPPWVGNTRFHESHQSNLLRKDKAFYSRYGWEVPDNLPYIWPSKEE